MNPNPLSVRRLIVPVVVGHERVLLVAHVCELQRRCYSYAVSHFAAREPEGPIIGHASRHTGCNHAGAL